MGPLLPKGQIAAQYSETGFGKCEGNGRQQFRLAVGACAVSEYQAVACIAFRLVQESANVGFGGEIGEWNGFSGHEAIKS